MDKEFLDSKIAEHVSGLTPQQIREVRLLCSDLMLEVREQCRAIAQDAVNRISDLK
jgi:hypothetical protein